MLLAFLQVGDDLFSEWERHVRLSTELQNVANKSEGNPREQEENNGNKIKIGWTRKGKGGLSAQEVKSKDVRGSYPTKSGKQGRC